MAEKRWFKDFPTEIKNGATSDDYLEHKLRLIALDDIDGDIDQEALQIKRSIEEFYALEGTVENDDLTYKFTLDKTVIIVTFDDDYNVRRYNIDEQIPDRSYAYHAKLICDFIRSIVRENAPEEAHKEVETMWKDVDSRHVVRGTDIAIKKISEVPTMLSIALGGKKMEESD